MLTILNPFIKKKKSNNNDDDDSSTIKKLNDNHHREEKNKNQEEFNIMEMTKEDENYIAFFHYLYDKDIMKLSMNESWIIFILQVTDYILNEWDDINPMIDQLYDELYYFSKKLKYNQNDEQQQQQENNQLFQLIRFIIYHCRSTIYYYQKNWMYTIIYCKKSLQLLPTELSSSSESSSSLFIHLSPLVYQKFISLQLHTLMLLTSSKKHYSQMNKFKPSILMMKNNNTSLSSSSLLLSPTLSLMNATITSSSSSYNNNNNLPILNIINLNNNKNNNNDSSSTESSLPSSSLPTTPTSNSSSSSSVTSSSSNTVVTNASAMICSYCFTEKKNMPVCAQCKIQIYCSIKCLKHDKQRHFNLCQKYQDC